MRINSTFLAKVVVVVAASRRCHSFKDGGVRSHFGGELKMWQVQLVQFFCLPS